MGCGTGAVRHRETLTVRSDIGHHIGMAQPMRRSQTGTDWAQRPNPIRQRDPPSIGEPLTPVSHGPETLAHQPNR